MRVSTVILSIIALCSAAMTIWADDKQRWTLVTICKPLAMIAMILIAAGAAPPAVPFYKYGIMAGLACSLVGDIFMMLRPKRFTEGLASFLVAHLFYIAAFLSVLKFQFTLWPLFPLILYVFIMMRILYPRLGKMKIPVIIYVLVIMTMARLAVERYLQVQEAKTLLVLIGALLFVISDSLLATNRFARPFRQAQFFILSSYFAAQWLITMSI
jgi:uncharacterized membrane protein YhhN